MCLSDLPLICLRSDPGEQREPHRGDDRDGPAGLERPGEGRSHDLTHPTGPLRRSVLIWMVCGLWQVSHVGTNGTQV